MTRTDFDAHEVACSLIVGYGADALDRTVGIVVAHREVGETSAPWDDIARAVNAILTGHCG
jgi:hypothetical protein